MNDKFSQIVSKFEQNRDENIKDLNKIHQFLTDLSPYFSKIINDYPEDDADDETRELRACFMKHGGFPLQNLTKYLELESQFFPLWTIKKNKTIEEHLKFFDICKYILTIPINKDGYFERLEKDKSQGSFYKQVLQWLTETTREMINFVNKNEFNLLEVVRVEKITKLLRKNVNCDSSLWFFDDKKYQATNNFMKEKLEKIFEEDDFRKKVLAGNLPKETVDLIFQVDGLTQTEAGSKFFDIFIGRALGGSDSGAQGGYVYRGRKYPSMLMDSDYRVGVLTQLQTAQREKSAGKYFELKEVPIANIVTSDKKMAVLGPVKAAEKNEEFLNQLKGNEGTDFQAILEILWQANIKFDKEHWELEDIKNEDEKESVEVACLEFIGERGRGDTNHFPKNVY